MMVIEIASLEQVKEVLVVTWTSGIIVVFEFVALELKFS
jgi:hypothetical protein